MSYIEWQNTVIEQVGKQRFKEEESYWQQLYDISKNANEALELNNYFTDYEEKEDFS